MKARSLADVYRDLEMFREVIADLKKDPQQAVAYDRLNQAEWRLHGKEDMANTLLADVAKFKTHLNELNEPTLGLMESRHKSDLGVIAGRVKGLVEVYGNVFKQDHVQLCDQLKSELGNIQEIVQQHQPPSQRPRLK